MTSEHASFSEYLAALKRRRRLFSAVTVLVILAAVGVAIVWPPTYRASAIIQIARQEIPQDFVRSTITTFADQRVQMTSQRIQSTQNLKRIIDRFDLYPEEMRRDGLERTVLKMRDAIGLEMISAEVVDPRSGQPMMANIAFELSFDYPNAGLASKVASQLMELYLSENQETRNRLASDTVEFLEAEAEKLQRRIRVLDDQLLDLETTHGQALPEFKDANIGIMQRTENELLDIDRQIDNLRERQVFIESQLAQIDPVTLYDARGRPVLNRDERMRSIETAYAAALSRYTERHPTVQRLRRELETLRGQLGSRDRRIVLEELQQVRNALAAAREKYSDSHPDVQMLRRMVEAIEDELEQRAVPIGLASSDDAEPSNPAYVQLVVQLDTAKVEIAGLQRTREQLREKLQEYEDRLTASPQVAKTYRALSREYQEALKQLAETRTRAMEAQLSESLESSRKGERFSVVEPPRVPLDPIAPNRPAILILGLILALAAGVGAVAVAESVRPVLRGERAFARCLGEPPLVTIPMVFTTEELARTRTRRRYEQFGTLSGALILTAAVMVMVHFYYRPLDALWFQALRRLGWF